MKTELSAAGHDSSVGAKIEDIASLKSKKTTQRLLKASKEIWDGYHIHPFVHGIADGTLDQKKFQYYMIQDYVYLLDYAKVFAIGVAKSQELRDMQLFSGSVSQIIDGEMDIHKGYMQRLGIDLVEAEHSAVALDNLSYTSYMLRVAYEDGPSEIAAAILSCALSYEVIAKEMLRTNPECINHPFYGEWVRGYSGADFALANRDLIDLIERLTADYSEARMKRLEDIFVACSRYEGGFWDMAWNMSV